MLLHLFLVTMATLSVWDIARRLFPTALPVVVGKLAWVAVAWCLLRYVPGDMLLALCVPGTLMLLGALLNPEPNVPWGPTLLEALRRLRKPPRSHEILPGRVGKRMPRNL